MAPAIDRNEKQLWHAYATHLHIYKTNIAKVYAKIHMKYAKRIK